jgi:zinc transport system substrate-binding protein
MENISKPILLLPTHASPHHYTLRPSEVKQLHEADLILWIGPSLETFLSKTLASIHAKLLTLEKTKHLKPLPMRDLDHHAHGASYDPHFWLDPQQVHVIAHAITQALMAQDPEHADTYQHNYTRFIAELKILDHQLSQQLTPLKKLSYVVFHDAYQYFEHRYQLTSLGSLSLHPEQPVSAQHLLTIRQDIQKTQASCIFSEPQFPKKFAHTLSQELNIKHAVLDPLGSEIPDTAQGYFELMRALANTLSECLNRTQP